MVSEYPRLWGENIRLMRKARGMTQGQLAEAVDVRTPSVSRWESGKAIPRDHHKIAIATALDCDVRMLFPLVRNGS